MSPLWIVLTLLPILGGAERFNCRGRILGAYYADAKSGCKAFHVCVRVAGGGIRDFRFFCPPGTLFHQEAQTCTDWGDDDPLACPADLYDGQFDLYKIGSGYDTKKLSSSGNREEEAEFGLQRAETGDRRLSQNQQRESNAPASDLRAAHSSDFFSGQRDRGRDDPAPSHHQPTNSPPAPSSHPRQSFRRPTSPRTPPTTQYTNPPSPQPSNPSNNVQYETKRKLVRKRPIYVSTQAPSTFAQNTPRQQPYSEQPQANFERRIPQQNRQPTPTSPPASVPPQYKDEYVEVSRVTPKQNRYFSNSPSPAPFSQSTPYFNKKEGLVELYNYEAQSTPGIKVNKDSKPFKVRNSFSVVPDQPREQDFVRTNVNTGRAASTTVETYTPARSFSSSTPAYRNFNSVSYEPEKNNFVQNSNAKQNYYNSPSTTPTTTVYTTTRSEPSFNLNTVAYNTNVGFNAQPSNYAESDEDDGQYRLPPGEDDGQYRPEQYERELLSGAHSLNIAASGNRLPEDQKPRAKTQKPPKLVSQTSAPRPFRPAPTPSTTAPPLPPSSSEPTTTYRPQTAATQRTFDYFQTYTTTSRPTETPVSVKDTVSVNFENVPVRPSTTVVPRTPEPRPQTRPPAPPQPSSTAAPRPTTRAPHFANPASNKEDTSYDYAYYDSDPGFSEYDHIEEFGKTKTKA